MNTTTRPSVNTRSMGFSRLTASGLPRRGPKPRFDAYAKEILTMRSQGETYGAIAAFLTKKKKISTSLPGVQNWFIRHQATTGVTPKQIGELAPTVTASAAQIHRETAQMLKALTKIVDIAQKSLVTKSVKGFEPVVKKKAPVVFNQQGERIKRAYTKKPKIAATSSNPAPKSPVLNIQDLLQAVLARASVTTPIAAPVAAEAAETVESHPPQVTPEPAS